MRCLKLLFIFVAFALLLEAAWTPTCTKFVFVNGINTAQFGTPDEPIGAQETVDILLKPQLKNYLAGKSRTAVCTSFALSYNDSQSWTKDMWESFRLLRNQGTDPSVYLYRNGLLAKAPAEDQGAFAYGASTTPVSDLVKTFAVTSNNSITTPTILQKIPASEKAALDRLVENLLKSIEEGNTTVCVGHSEGNFFCNLAYRIILDDSSGRLKKLGLSLHDEKVLQVIGLATPSDFVADSKNRYLTACSDVVGAVPNSLPPNYTDSNVCGDWRSLLWNLITGNWFVGCVNLIKAGTVGVNKHLVTTYFAQGAEAQGAELQNRAMQLLESGLPDPSCGADLNCSLKDDFSAANSYTANWLLTKKSGNAKDPVQSGGYLRLESYNSLLSDGELALRTRRVFTGPFTISFKYDSIGTGSGFLRLKNAKDDSVALNYGIVLAGWHTAVFTKTDAQVSLSIDGGAPITAPSDAISGYYLELDSYGDNTLLISDLSVVRATSGSGSNTTTPPPLPTPAPTPAPTGPVPISQTSLASDPSLVAYYPFEGNSNDSKGTNHGTPTNITYAAGKFGQAAVFNSASYSQIQLASLPVSSVDKIE